MIRYLEKGEFTRCRPLWTEAFPEDSEQFKDYYFGRRITRGRILVREEEGRITSMAHLSPYELAVGEKRWPIDYVVGVATPADCRRRGYMREVLLRMLRDMQAAGTPFCFLMPAAAAIYRPFDFTYICDLPFRRPDVGRLAAFKRKPLKLDAQAKELAEWENAWFSCRYEVYARRDARYMRTLADELASEGGEAQGWYDGGRLMALQGVWGLKEREQRFFYSLEDAWARGEADRERADHDGIMARITCLSELMKAIRLTEDCPEEAMEVPLRVHDPLLEENDGSWSWYLTREGSEVRRFCGAAASSLCSGRAASSVLRSGEALAISAADLASWLFGYRPLIRLTGEEPPFWSRYVRVLKGVLLDEVV